LLVQLQAASHTDCFFVLTAKHLDLYKEKSVKNREFITLSLSRDFFPCGAWNDALMLVGTASKHVDKDRIGVSSIANNAILFRVRLQTLATVNLSERLGGLLRGA